MPHTYTFTDAIRSCLKLYLVFQKMFLNGFLMTKDRGDDSRVSSWIPTTSMTQMLAQHQLILYTFVYF